MNAYQLSDALNEYNEDGFSVLVVEQAVDMLRKQADRIAELEKRLKEEFDYSEKLLAERNQ